LNVERMDVSRLAATTTDKSATTVHATWHSAWTVCYVTLHTHTCLASCMKPSRHWQNTAVV